tara:strand:+ start:1573 stop:1818 length:246 start_codon:yes stop_codon:yes gene_type:complete
MQIKKLNDILINQNIIIQTLIEVILEKDIITEKELEFKLDSNINQANNIIAGFEKTSEKDVEYDTDDEIVNSMYYGPMGDC